MPWSPAAPCSEPGCAQRAVHRGRCALHRRTETERGYGRAWRRVRARVRAEVTACEECGSADDLTVDHRVPQSLGGGNDRANLRVLCRHCHAVLGMKRTRMGGRGSVADR